MTHLRTYTALVAALLLAAACSVYHPQPIDMPLLQEEGETRVDGTFGVSVVPFISGPYMGATVSHAFTDWMSGQAHLNMGGRSCYGHAAWGAYYPWGERFVVEGFAGLGAGGRLRTVESAHTSGNGAVEYGGFYLLPYVQVDFGWRRLWIFELSFGVRRGLLLPWFYSIEYDPEDVDLVVYEERYRHANLLFEPSVQLRIGGRHIMYTTRIGFTNLPHLNNAVYGDDAGLRWLSYDAITFSFGLNFML